MIRSMTSFARSFDMRGKEGWEIEIRSVNHRFFEFSMKAPPAVSSYETRIRTQFQNSLRRGKVFLAIIAGQQLEDAAKKVSIDEEIVLSYISAAEDLRAKFGLTGELTLQDIISMPRVFTTGREKELEEKSWIELEKILSETLEIAVENRLVEGRKLALDISERLQSIEAARQRVDALTAGQGDKHMKRLSEKIGILLKDKELDQERLHREVAFLVERNDVTEELVRLDSHIKLFLQRLDSDEEVGRELDFLCQEMNREMNTLGSKSQLFEISTDVIHMKKELEKIREQVQNIE